MEIVGVLMIFGFFFTWLMVGGSRTEPRVMPPTEGHPNPEETFTLRISDPDASAALYGYAFNAEQFGRRELADKMFEMADRWNGATPEPSEGAE